MMATTVSSALRLAGPARLAVRQPRVLAAMPAPRRSFSAGSVRAQQEQSKGDVPVQQQQQQQAGGALTPRLGTPLTTLAPSWGRVNQVFAELEREMNQLSRAFGMPSFGPSLFTDMDALLPAMAEETAPMMRTLAVDIRDTGNALEISADVPGLSKDDIKVQVSPDRVLSISGERKSEHKEGSEEEGNLRIERSFGTFMRRFRLPEGVDVEGIKASTKDGVLRLTVPKTEQAQPKQIDVQVSE